MDYKINSRRQIQLLKSDLIGYLIGNLILGFIVWNINDGDFAETIIVMLIALIPMLLPLLVLHLNYYFINRYHTITIDKDRSSIIIRGRELRKEFTFKDIENIIVVKGICYKNENETRSAWKISSIPFRVPWSDYGYIKIFFKNKEVMVLSALMVDLKQIPFENYKTKYKPIPIISD